jgi:hypothetical protein
MDESLPPHPLAEESGRVAQMQCWHLRMNDFSAAASYCPGLIEMELEGDRRRQRPRAAGRRSDGEYAHRPGADSERADRSRCARHPPLPLDQVDRAYTDLQQKPPGFIKAVVQP